MILAGSALLGGVFSYAALTAIVKSGLHIHDVKPWTLLLTPVAAAAAVGFHELGHVVFGLANGFRFYLLAVGPLLVERLGDRVRFRLNKMPAWWGGIASCMPREFGPGLRHKMIWFTAGGPVFSLLGAGVLGIAWWLRSASPNTAFVALIFGLGSAAVAVATLIPAEASGSISDGARLWMLLRRQPGGERWVALAAVVGLAMAERPRDWPPELLTMLGDGGDGKPDGVWVCVMRHMWHWDRRHLGQAEIDALPGGWTGHSRSRMLFHSRPV
jgi:hypothetical protein